MNQELELLAPAGSLETLKAVILAGADAVYAGGDMFGARAYAKNFSNEEILEAIDFVHMHDKKMMLTVNTLLKDEELKNHLYNYILPFYEQGLDAVIVQDFGVLSFLHRNFPGLELHTSTQMTVTDASGALFLAKNGATRIVGARELTLKEIKAIYDETHLEIESFIHGALCYCYSGQCLFSSILGGRSGNRGRCAQPCRLNYSVTTPNQQRGKKELPILSLKDLSTLEFIPELAEHGVYSFKIEGRMKQTEYAKGVVSMYRKYIDLYLKNGKEKYQVSKKDMEELLQLGNRSGFTKGYYYQHNDSDMITYEKPSHTKKVETTNIKSEIKETKEIYTENKIKVHGILTLQVGKSAILEVSDGTNSVSFEGNVVEKAKNAPMLMTTIDEKMRKTGNTIYEFESLEIHMDDSIFMPVQELNRIRREALDLLKESTLFAYRRKRVSEEPSYLADVLSHKETQLSSQSEIVSSHDNKSISEALHVSVETSEAFQEILNYNFVSEIYLDSMVLSKNEACKELLGYIKATHDKKKKLFLILPAICRNQTTKDYQKLIVKLNESDLDGYIVKNYDELGLIEAFADKTKDIRLDHNMYTYSNEAQAAFANNSYTKNTVPFELNRKELLRRNNEMSEMILYGYIPLMVSAQCVHKNTASCDKNSTLSYLKDRYDKTFAIKNNCKECYNVISNSSPLFLLHQRKDLERMHFSSYRLMFTMETKAQIAEIMNLYQKVFIKKDELKENEMPKDFTNGHFKRGVE